MREELREERYAVHNTRGWRLYEGMQPGASPESMILTELLRDDELYTSSLGRDERGQVGEVGCLHRVDRRLRPFGWGANHRLERADFDGGREPSGGRHGECHGYAGEEGH